MLLQRLVQVQHFSPDRTGCPSPACCLSWVFRHSTGQRALRASCCWTIPPLLPAQAGFALPGRGLQPHG